MEVRISIITELGEFFGQSFEISDEEYTKLKNDAKTFYSQGGFEMVTRDGGYIVLAPDVVKKSIIKIEVSDVQE